MCRSTDGVAGNLYEVKFITERTGFILGEREQSIAPQQCHLGMHVRQSSWEVYWVCRE